MQHESWHGLTFNYDFFTKTKVQNIQNCGTLISTLQFANTATPISVNFWDCYIIAVSWLLASYVGAKLFDIDWGIRQYKYQVGSGRTFPESISHKDESNSQKNLINKARKEENKKESKD